MRQTSRLISIALVVGSLGPFFITSAQSSVDSQQLIRNAVSAADWVTANSEINKLRGIEPNTFRAKGYDYLLARIAEKTGDMASATVGYQAVASGNPQLAPYAHWHLARMARSTGDLVLEREHLRKLITEAPQAMLFNAAALRLAESYFESGDNVGAADTAKKVIASTNVPLAREASALMGQAYVRSGKETEARDLFTKLIMQMPDASRPDDFALIAVREIDALDKKPSSTSTAKLSEADRLLRASIYQFNRDFAGARIHYQALIDDYPQSGTVPNAMYNLARGVYLEGKYEDALKLFQRVVDQFPQSSSARDAQAYVASSYLRLKRTDDGVNAYQQFISLFPDAPNPERPYLNIIDSLHEAGRYPEALSWAQQTRARFKSDLGGALALFAQLRIHLAQGAWADGITDADELLKLSDLGGARVAGGTTPSEVSFLRAFALEQQGRIDDAVNSYLAIPDGRNEYYGARATLRLLALGSGPKAQTSIQSKLNSSLATARSAMSSGQFEQARLALQSALRLTQDSGKRTEVLKDLRAAYDALPAYKFQAFTLEPLVPVTESIGAVDDHQQLAETLAALALYDEALPELLVANSKATQSANANRTATGGPNDAGYTVAYYALRGGLANRAVRFAEQVWKNVPADYVIDLAPRELVEFLYPMPYREVLLQHAASRKVDPRFVLSIARQESRYQADAKSIAAARGMMQFIPATANEIATQLKLTNFNQDDLYDAGTAILFGSHYLASLFQQFPDQPDAVAAAYNGGAENMARWLARSRSKEPDRYVSEIGYSQSKDYVFRVMSNFWNYQRLYDSQLRPVRGLTK